MQPNRSESVALGNGEIELRDIGRGRPLLFLHPGMGLFGADPFLNLLAEQFRVIAPSHPGFGLSGLPEWMSSVDDLAYRYLDLFEELDVRDVILVGSSFGGWIAAEVAVKSVERIGRLVLIDPLGIKIGGREQRDIADIYGLPRDELDRRLYCDVSVKPDIAKLSDEKLKIFARNRESEALFGWSPYMHNPKLRGRLHRIAKPAFVLCGANDRIVSPDYGQAFAAAIPGAAFGVISGAAHYPHIEQPQDCVRHIQQFLENQIAVGTLA